MAPLDRAVRSRALSAAARPVAAAALAVLVAAPFVVTGLGRRPFDDPGEGMHAEIARELLASGDPFRLTLNGVPYVDKPPLLYALVAGAWALAGPGEGAARAVPAGAALVAVGATAWLGARLAGTGAGVLAGGALLTCPGFLAYARYLRPEALFVAALAAGFALALVGLAESRRAMVAAGLGAFGVAALAKDPLGALAPPLVIGAALGLAGRARPLGRWLPWPGVAALALLGFAWWLPAEIKTPGFVWYTVVDNHILNVVRLRRFPDEDVPLSAAEFLAVAGLGATPWVVSAAALAWRLARLRAWRDPSEMPWSALALWALGVLVFTALSPFRLPHYGLPAYLALALLAARGWRDLPARSLAAAHAGLLAALAAAAALLWSSDGALLGRVLAVTDVATRKAGGTPALPEWDALAPLLGLTALAFGAGALALGGIALGTRRHAPAAPARSGTVDLGKSSSRPHLAPSVPGAADEGSSGPETSRRRRTLDVSSSTRAGEVRTGGRRRAPAWLCESPVAACVVVGTMLAFAPSVSAALALVATHRAVKPIALEIARRAGAGDLVAHEGPIENSGAFEWYAGHRPVIVDGRRSVLGFGATRPETPDVFWDRARLGRVWESGRRVWVVTGRRPEGSVVATLPGARLVAVAGGRRLYVNR